VGFIAEYDALKELSHACGHNLIAAASVGALLSFSGIKDELPGQVMFTVHLLKKEGEEKLLFEPHKTPDSCLVM